MQQPYENPATADQADPPTDTHAPNATAVAPPTHQQRTTSASPVRSGPATHRNAPSSAQAMRTTHEAVQAGSKYLGVVQAAEYLGMKERFIRRLVAERRIRFYKVGRHVRFAVEDLEAFAQAGRVEPVSVTWQGGRVIA